ncbi:MAG TPA: RNA polymerase sigma factor [Kofleriaceae bacterium]|nr:RNA polymerase sigma factor [Kofleriaceae bacterium]
MPVSIALANAGSATRKPTPRRADIGQHRAVLQRIARKLCGNDAAADDLVHDTYVRALRAGDRYDDRGNLRSWLIVILHNLFLDRCRRAKRSRVIEYVAAHELPAPEPIAPLAWERVTPAQVRAAIARLGPEFRCVFDLHVAGCSYNEIAEELQIPKNSVGTRLLRARKKLKAALLAELDGGRPQAP